MATPLRSHLSRPLAAPIWVAVLPPSTASSGASRDLDRWAVRLLKETLESGEVPAHYSAQVQHQLMVSGAALAHLLVFDGRQGLLHEIRPDPAMHDCIRVAWEAFAEFLDHDTPAPLADADSRQRDDEGWRVAAQAFRDAKAEAAQAAARVEAARAALVALAGHPKECGAGVTVTRFWKAGAVDCKRVVELKGVDLERYRGKSREEVRVTVGVQAST